jgi:hypothetical protein
MCKNNAEGPLGRNAGCLGTDGELGRLVRATRQEWDPITTARGALADQMAPTTEQLRAEARSAEATAERRRITAMLDGIPGAYERARLGLELARAGETIGLEET